MKSRCPFFLEMTCNVGFQSDLLGAALRATWVFAWNIGPMNWLLKINQAEHLLFSHDEP